MTLTRFNPNFFNQLFNLLSVGKSLLQEIYCGLITENSAMEHINGFLAAENGYQ